MADCAVGYLQPGVESSRPTGEKPVEACNWYALYTCSRHEKLVHLQLTAKAIEAYLPLYTSLRRWNDRTALVELPLFPGYLFVRIPLSARLRVLTVPGTVRLVGFNGTLASLAEDEIQSIKTAVALQIAEPCPYLAEGKRIRITNGPLKGLEGIVTRRKGKLRAVVSVHSIMQSFSVEVDAMDTQPTT
jgi:transcription antitermination factor NusG